MRRAVIYARSARDPGGRQVRLQEEFCREVCRRKGWQVAGVFVDANVTAPAVRRPGFGSLVAMISARQCDVLVCFEMARVSRDLQVIAEVAALCREAGVDWCIGGFMYDPAGRIVATLSGLADPDESIQARRLAELEAAGFGRMVAGLAPVRRRR